MTLQDKIGNLPASPGVYQFLDERGEVLYIGKAKRLRSRVKSYFRDSSPREGRIGLMVAKIADLEVIVTDSEAEALILENTLIKKRRPRYNILYRDDKSYPYICLTREERPRVYPTRTVLRDGSRYFGPYDHVGHMRRVIETIRKSFGFCTCAVNSRTIDKHRSLPRWHACFDDYLKNCSGDWEIDRYLSQMEHVERLLNGRTDELLRSLGEEMKIASDALEFEQAARVRDAIDSVHRFSKRMKVVAEKAVNRDIFALSVDRQLDEACGVLFKIREGKLVGTFHRFSAGAGQPDEGETLQAFMEDYYTGQFAGAIPDEVYVSHELPDPDPLLEYLWQELGRKVPIRQPQIGEKRELVRMAISNAAFHLGERKLEKQKADRERIPQAVRDLKSFLHLQRVPRRIECFDNSNIQGSDPVASMVCFVDGRPRKSEYKRFHIKSVEGADDYASMKEVVLRRYRRLREEKGHLPDLVLIDGGRGQLNAAAAALEEAGVAGDVELAGLAKRLEEVYLPDRLDPVMISKTSSALKLLRNARDEAHRFAVAFHQSVRSGRTVRSELTSIPGVGEKIARSLLREFGSVKKISSASLETLQKAAGPKTGKAIHEHFHGNN